MEKMKKKAFIEVDIIAVIIIAIFFFILMLSMSFIKPSSYQANAFKLELNNDLFLNLLLKSKAGDYTLKEIILKDYSKNEFTETKTYMNQILTAAFGEKVCWNLIIQGTLTKEDSDCKEMTKLNIGSIDAVAYLPFEKENEIKRIEVILKN
jgi:hypothetical protein